MNYTTGNTQSPADTVVNQCAPFCVLLKLFTLLHRKVSFRTKLGTGFAIRFTFTFEMCSVKLFTCLYCFCHCNRFIPYMNPKSLQIRVPFKTRFSCVLIVQLSFFKIKISSIFFFSTSIDRCCRGTMLWEDKLQTFGTLYFPNPI